MSPALGLGLPKISTVLWFNPYPMPVSLHSIAICLLVLKAIFVGLVISNSFKKLSPCLLTLVDTGANMPWRSSVPCNHKHYVNLKFVAAHKTIYVVSSAL